MVLLYYSCITPARGRDEAVKQSEKYKEKLPLWLLKEGEFRAATRSRLTYAYLPQPIATSSRPSKKDASERISTTGSTSSTFRYPHGGQRSARSASGATLPLALCSPGRKEGHGDRSTSGRKTHWIYLARQRARTSELRGSGGRPHAIRADRSR